MMGWDVFPNLHEVRLRDLQFFGLKITTVTVINVPEPFNNWESQESTFAYHSYRRHQGKSRIC